MSDFTSNFYFFLLPASWQQLAGQTVTTQPTNSQSGPLLWAGIPPAES